MRGLLQSARLVKGLDRLTRVTSGSQRFRILAAGHLDVVMDAPIRALGEQAARATRPAIEPGARLAQR